MDSINTKSRNAVDVELQVAAARNIRQWINTCPDKPCQIGMEYLPDDFGATMTITETPYKVRQYVTGGYLAVCEFDVIYRTMPATDDERLAAGENLDKLAVWACNNANSLKIDGARVKRVQRQTPATLSARYTNGAEDHSAHMIITFEVI